MKAIAKTLAKRTLEALDPLARWRFRVTTGATAPIPPMRFRARTASRWVGRFVESGKNCAKALEDALAKTTGKAIYDFESVLDFGCGCGRTIMNWKRESLRGLVGCDVDAAAIAWMQRAYGRWSPKLRFAATRFDPPLPFEPGQFDLVYSVSIFSHLSGEDQALWRDELARVMRPGGIALITTQGPHAWKQFTAPGARHAATPAAGHDLERDDFVFIYYPPRPGAEPAPGVESPSRPTQYGLTFMTRRHVDAHFNTPQWEVVEVFEGTVDDLQDVVVLRRKEA